MTQQATQLRRFSDSYTYDFRKRRSLNWISLGIAFVTLSMARYSLTFTGKNLAESFRWTDQNILSLTAVGLWVAAASALINGVITDRIGGRKALLICAAGTAVTNLFFGLGAYLGFAPLGKGATVYFSTVWALNSFFYTFALAATIKINAGWFHVTERGVFAGIFQSIVYVAKAFAFLVPPLALSVLSWQWGFFIPALLISLVALVVWKLVCELPVDCGLPALETQDASTGQSSREDWHASVIRVITTPELLLAAIARFCTGFVRYAFIIWFVKYIGESHRLSTESAVFQGGSGALILASIIGAVTAGSISDWVHGSKRGPAVCVAFIIQALCVLIFWNVLSLGWVIAAYVLFSFADGMQETILGMTFPMDFGGVKGAGTASGLLDSSYYLGAALVGPVVYYVLSHYSWSMFGPMMLLPLAASAAAMALLWNSEPVPRRRKKQEEYPPVAPAKA